MYLSKQQLDDRGTLGSQRTDIQDYNQGSDQTYYQFYVTEPTNIKIIGNIIRGLGTYDDIKDAYIELRWFTTLLKRWDLVGLYNEPSLSVDYETQLDPKSSYPYSVVVSIPNNLGNQWGSSTKHISANASIFLNSTTISDFNFSYGGGIRVKKETIFDLGKTIPSLIYKYDYDRGDDKTGHSNGKLMTPLQFHYKYIDVARTIPGSQNLEYFNEYEINSSNWYPENSFSNGSTVGYSSVDVHAEGLSNWYTGNSNFELGKTTNRFHLQVDDTYNLRDYLLGAPLWIQPLNGKLYEKIVYDKNNTIKKQENYDYTYSLETFLHGLYAINYDRGIYKGDGTFGTYGKAITYPIQSYLVNLVKKVEKEDEVTSEHFLRYNTRGQLICDSTFSSKGQAIKTIFKYPFDHTSQDPVLLGMVNNNILDKLISKEIFYPNNEFYKEIYKYNTTQFVANPFCPDISPIYSLMQRDIYMNVNLDKQYIYIYI